MSEDVSRIVFSILNCDFNTAITITDSLISIKPEDPLPELMKLVTIGMRDIDYDSTIDSSGFLLVHRSASEKIKQYKQKHGTSSYSLTLEGFCLAIHSSFYLRIKSYFDVLQNGIDAIKLLKQAKELDSTNAEVDLFLGLYDYGKSELKKRLWWVMFWYPGTKKNGIRKLNECAQNARITNTAALLSLSDIYLEEKQTDLSVKILKELEKKYPRSRFVLWGKTKYFEATGKYSEAAGVYKRLSEEYAVLPQAETNYFLTRNKLAHMLKKSGQTDTAKEICTSILKEKRIDFHKDVKKDTRKLLERLNES